MLPHCASNMCFLQSPQPERLMRVLGTLELPPTLPKCPWQAALFSVYEGLQEELSEYGVAVGSATPTNLTLTLTLTLALALALTLTLTLTLTLALTLTRWAPRCPASSTRRCRPGYSHG